MLNDLGAFTYKVLYSAINMLNSASVWMVISFLIAGILHEFLNPQKVQKTSIGSKKVSGVFWTTISGKLIPIGGCGTMPLGICM